MQKSMQLAIIALSWGGLMTMPAAGAETDLSLRLGAVVAPLSDDAAGSGPDSPDYSDAFDTGLGISVELAYRYSDRFSFVAGTGYEKYSGDEYEEISFDALKMVPVYVGARYHFGTGISKWDPYIRVAGGTARIESVDVSFAGFSEKYWKSSWVGLFDFGGGVEYRFDTLSVFAEVRARYLGEPDSDLEPFADADSSWSLPMSIGIAFRF